ncbi:MAG: tetratricopeptide repeat protein, partial [Burkholderiaceae bacterium]|nr:tetratricopeptide repeat protein [Burkholderiaceae bacterium]
MIVLKSLRGPAFVVLALLPYGASGWDGYSPDSRPVEIPASAPVRQTSDPSAGVLDEAESLYRAGRWPAAMDAFQGIVAADPDNAHAWLRIGNLHQRRRQFTQAASAYRRAASLSERAAAGQPKGGPDTAASVRSGAVDVP